MGIFDDIRTLFRSKSKNSVNNVDLKPDFNGPLKLRYGSFVEFDNLVFNLIEDKTLFGHSPQNQKISAVGKVDLGQGVKLQRYYFDDDETWLQVNTQGNDGDDGVEEIILWKYYKTDTPTSNKEVERLIGCDSGLGLPSLKVENHVYDRVWGTDLGYAQFVSFNEDVHIDKDNIVDYTVSHRCMLYRREIEDSSRMEFYLVSAEENDGISIVHSVGISINREDIKNF